MASAEATVEELVGMIQRGELRLPEMQRQYVWKKTRVRDLLDSLYREYPSGTILVWDTETVVQERGFGVTQEKSAFASSTRLLLDGQQRLTSLSAVLRGEPVTVRGNKKPIEILFNLEHPDAPAFVTEVDEDEDDDDDDEGDGEETPDASKDELQERFERMAFVVGTKKLEQLPHWVKVSDVFRSDGDAEFLARSGVEKVTDARYKKYSERLAKLRRIRKYVYRMDVLPRTLSYEEVTEIFVRVNSLGAKLRSSDLALAQITARWPGSLATFLEFQRTCDDKGFPLDLGVHLKNLVAVGSGQSRFRTVGTMSVETLKASWAAAVPAMEYALNFLKNNAGIGSPALLASPFLLVALGYFGHKRGYAVSASDAEDLRRWVLVANAKGRYSRGSTESFLDQDLTLIKEGGGPKELLDRLRLQVGRLDIAPEELEGRNRRSALFKTMFLAFRAAGAQDWSSNIGIALDHKGNQHKLQFHHLFPKAVLRKHYPARDADDIANLAFIGGKTNRQISDREPAKYFPEVFAKSTSAAFDAQCIPTDSVLLSVSAYRDFLAERRTRIAARLNAFLGVP
ncbi:MAG: DUF262 domain-containing protein [Deltaproteobacteria bacterium]|nr:DUF262 domain-containing protein [Myxococcales bacterium]MDP3218990.1 DUF262 domain-containing protein [Deltaproteobacteria bacterium]